MKYNPDSLPVIQGNSLQLGISLGDITGIGPEVAMKAVATLASPDGPRWVLVGDRQVIQQHAGLLGVEERLPDWSENPEAPVSIWQPAGDIDLAPDRGSTEPARSAMVWLEAATRACVAGHLHGMVTAPVSKSAIVDAGFSGFHGQTEFIAALAGVSDPAMMLLGHDEQGRWLRVALATIHLPVSQVAAAVTPDAVKNAVRRAALACDLLGLERRRIAVCGLNPHAGENGKMGEEEIRIIRPSVECLRAEGLDVHGPFAADTLFHSVYRGDYEAVVAMYHDQGLVPLKMVAFDSGVNWTLGLPFVRTSPDHGTAFDIAGKGMANPSSMIAAMELAVRIATRMKEKKTDQGLR